MTSLLIKYAPGSTRYERYASTLVKLLKEECYLRSSREEYIRPLCIILHSKNEQTVYKGLIEILRHVSASSHPDPRREEAIFNSREMQFRDKSSPVGQDSCKLIQTLMDHGTVESCWNIALKWNRLQVAETATQILSVFALCDDGVSRITKNLERDLERITDFCVSAPPCRADSNTEFRSIDILVDLQGSSEFVFKMVENLILQNQMQRLSTLFLDLLTLAANSSAWGMHTICHKVGKLLTFTMC